MPLQLSFHRYDISNIGNIGAMLLRDFSQRNTDISFRFQAVSPTNWLDTYQGVTLIVATDQDTGQIVALAEVLQSDDTAKQTLESFEVVRQYQGMGVGTALLAHLLNDHVKRKGQQLFLECDNETLPFYRKAITSNGYTIVKHVMIYDQETKDHHWNGLTIGW